MFDCMMINDELDLLEIRLNTLDNVVEKFVIVESLKTHSGKDKPLHFAANQKRFEHFAPKIIHIVYPGHVPQNGYEVWGNENSQRDWMLRAWYHTQPSDDLCYYSDLDEIPRPEKLLEAKRLYEQNNIPVAFNLHYCMYFFNYSFDVPSRGPILYNPAHAEAFHARIGRLIYSPTDVRWHSNTPGYERDFQNIDDAGWHFSSMGGHEQLKKKIAACAHVEYNTDEIISEENIQRAVEEGRLYFGDGTTANGSGERCKKRDLGFLPDYVLRNLDRFGKYILQ